MADKYLTLDETTRRTTRVEATVVSTGASEAGDLVALDGAGRLDESVLPTGIGADVAVIQASEALAAGDFVNIHNDSGARVRKADASDPAKQAHGFVLAVVSSAANATVYFEGSNTEVSGLTPGVSYVLSHSSPGGVLALSAGPLTAGTLLQPVGVATAATVINVEIHKPIENV